MLAEHLFPLLFIIKKWIFTAVLQRRVVCAARTGETQDPELVFKHLFYMYQNILHFIWILRFQLFVYFHVHGVSTIASMGYDGLLKVLEK